MNSDKGSNSNNGNKMQDFQYTFLCEQCHERHTIIEFSDYELEYLDYLLNIHRDVVKGSIKDRDYEDKAELEGLEEEVDMLNHIINCKISPREDVAEL